MKRTWIIICSMVILSTNLFSQQSISFDVENLIVDGVDLKKDIKSIIKKIGQKRVEVKQENNEEGRVNYYVIDFNGHKVYHHWYGIEISDSVFKIENALSTRVPFSQIHKYYGEGRFRTEGELDIGYWFMIGQREVLIQPVAKCIIMKEEGGMMQFGLRTPTCKVDTMQIMFDYFEKKNKNE